MLEPGSQRVALILAAGKGTRMKSDLPKVLHKLRGRYMIHYVIEAARQAGLKRQIVVIGHRGQLVREALGDRGVEFVVQERQLGTGHAVMMAEPLLRRFEGDLVVLCGDMPLVKAETIGALIAERHKLKAAAVVLTAILDDPGRYGRIVRDENNMLRAIVEYKDADRKTKAIKEINTGTYCFDWSQLRPVLAQLDDRNAQGEFYLTDSISILVENGKRVGALVADDAVEGFGINSLEELKMVENLMAGGTS